MRRFLFALLLSFSLVLSSSAAEVFRVMEIPCKNAMMYAAQITSPDPQWRVLAIGRYIGDALGKPVAFLVFDVEMNERWAMLVVGDQLVRYSEADFIAKFPTVCSLIEMEES